MSSHHSLPGHLAVTLTSYPPRYSTLALTLKSILSQSVKPDAIYLWLAGSHVPMLPHNVASLEADGISILTCPDLRSYKKLIPALELAQHEFLVTADDDIYYHRHWLRELTTAYNNGKREVICARAHRIRLNTHGTPLPYLQWQLEVQPSRDRYLLFPTSGAGALYPPGTFYPDVTCAELFQSLCPTADDVWFYWMAALNGFSVRKVGPRRRLITWCNSQDVALFSINAHANDIQIANMIERYGFPQDAPHFEANAQTTGLKGRHIRIQGKA